MKHYQSETRFGAILLIQLMFVVLTGQAQAGKTYTIEWQSYHYRNTSVCTSECDYHCANAALQLEGDCFFKVNGLPIPSYTQADSFYQDVNGDQQARFDAHFNSNFLRVGQNWFYFGYHTEICNFASERVYLHKKLLPDFDINKWYGVTPIPTDNNAIPLFTLEVDQKEFEGVTSVGFELKDISKEVHDAIVELKQTVANRLSYLERMSGNVEAAKLESDRINELEAELKNILSLGFDAITSDMLADLVCNYEDIYPDIYAKLVDFVETLQKEIDELHQELAQMKIQFREEIDNVLDSLAAGAEQSGFNLTDENLYEPGADTDDIPDVDIPEIVDEDDFDVDPYAAYADQVIAELQSKKSGDIVVDRAGFLSIAASWHENQEMIETSLSMRAKVSNEEWGAFWAAQKRVLAVIGQHVDENGWFRDNPVPKNIQTFIDDWIRGNELVGLDCLSIVSILKHNFNLWYGELNPNQQLIVSMMPNTRAYLRALDQLMLLGEEGIEATEIPDIFGPIVDFLTALGNFVHLAVDTTVSIMPFVGDTLDLCELLSGRRYCLADGKDLTFSERVLSGLGLLIGSGTFWRSFGNAGEAISNVGRTLGDINDKAKIIGIETRADRQLLEAEYSAAIGHKPGAFNDLGRMKRNGQRNILIQEAGTPTCGPTSCSMVLDTFGNVVSVDELLKKAYLDVGSASDLTDLSKALKEYNLDNWVRRNVPLADLARTTDKGIPVIAAVWHKAPGGTKIPHAVVVDGITTRYDEVARKLERVVAIRDPHGTQYFEKYDVFKDRFLKHAIIPRVGLPHTQ